jgi:hypothetical protein
VAFSDEFLGTGVEIMNRMTWIAAAVAACAASISPSQAFTDADLDRLAAEILESKTAPGVGDAINDLSSELIECSAITMVSAICIGKTPGQDSNAGQPLENISSWTCATFLLVAAISASCSSVFESPVKHSSQVPRID